MSNSVRYSDRQQWLCALWRGEQTGPAPDGLVAFLHQHGLVPLVLHHVESQGQSDQRLLADLRDQAKQEAVFALESERVLAEALDALKQQGIAPILFKGAALVRQVYDPPSTRPRGDSDVLVPAPMFETAIRVLESLGYEGRTAVGDRVTSALTMDLAGRFGLEHTIDLHHQISSLPHTLTTQLTYGVLKERAPSIDGVHVLAPGDALLLAIFHRAQHFSHEGERLIWLHDIHLLVPLVVDDSEIAGRMMATGIGSAAIDALTKVTAWFGTEVPAEWFDVLAEDGSAAFLETDLDQGRLNRLQIALASTEGVMGKLRFAWQVLFPPLEYMRTQGAVGWRLPLAYVLRVVDGLRVVLRSLIPSRASNSE